MTDATDPEPSIEFLDALTVTFEHAEKMRNVTATLGPVLDDWHNSSIERIAADLAAARTALAALDVSDECRAELAEATGLTEAEHTTRVYVELITAALGQVQ